LRRAVPDGRQIDLISSGVTLLRRRVAPRRLRRPAVDLWGEAHVRPVDAEAWPTICGGTHRKEVTESPSWPQPEGPAQSCRPLSGAIMDEEPSSIEHLMTT